MKIFFFIDSVFPYGSAWSSRGRSFASLFQAMGHEVHVLASYTNELNGEESDVQYFKGIPYQALSTKPKRLEKLFIPIKALYSIATYIRRNKVDLVFSSSVPMFFQPLRRFLKGRKIPLVIEQCEWFDPLTFIWGKNNPYYKAVIRNIEHHYHRSDGIIAISSLLEDHYKSQGANVIRVPTILDISEIEYTVRKVHDDCILRLAFAGNIGGKKELLRPVFEAMANVEDDVALRFTIIGPSEKEVIENIDNDHALFSRVKSRLVFLGRIPQQEVEKQLRDSDFMVFIRPDRRSSNAGFPTKFVESLAVGTPVITNLTSDIGMYLRDGKNGFITEEPSAESISNAIRRISKLTSTEREELRKNSRQTAEENFDYRIYGKEVKEFIDTLKP